jgi:hypothetical protein
MMAQQDDGFSPLKVHVIPKLGNRDVQEIDQRDIFEVLKPIWHIKADSARKALGRVGHVLQHAAAMGLSVDLNVVPLAKELLGKSKLQPKKHHLSTGKKSQNSIKA